MEDRHGCLLERAHSAIGDVHSDQSVSLERTLDSLELLHDYVAELVGAIEEDIERKQMEEGGFK